MLMAGKPSLPMPKLISTYGLDGWVTASANLSPLSSVGSVARLNVRHVNVVIVRQRRKTAESVERISAGARLVRVIPGGKLAAGRAGKGEEPARHAGGAGQQFVGGHHRLEPHGRLPAVKVE